MPTLRVSWTANGRVIGESEFPVVDEADVRRTLASLERIKKDLEIQVLKPIPERNHAEGTPPSQGLPDR